MPATKFNKPFEIASSSDFIAELESYLSDYIIYAETLLQQCESTGQITTTDKNEFSDRLKNATIKIVASLNLHRKGHIHACNNCFDELMITLAKVFEKQVFYNSFVKGSNFFRIRQDEVIPSTENKFAVFHIPFSLRRKVANLRFNAPGFPCLYCANNLETAWVECRRPGSTSFTTEKKFLNTAVFSISEELAFVDISYKNFDKLKVGAALSQPGLVEYINYIQLFPLIASLHCKIIYAANEWINFHYEYLLPTMFMHWFINDKESRKILPQILNAVKYSSVENFNPEKHFNIVSPAKFNPAAEYCSYLEGVFLKKYFNYYHRQLGVDKIDTSDIIKLEADIINLLP